MSEVRPVSYTHLDVYKRQAKGYAVTGDYTEVYAESEIVLLAVKPQNFDEILPNLAKYEGEKPLVVSIAAGVTFAKLEGALGADTAMIRVMPNTCLLYTSPYARDAPDFVISETRIPSSTRKIQILILSPNLPPMMVKVVSTAFSGWKPV